MIIKVHLIPFSKILFLLVLTMLIGCTTSTNNPARSNRNLPVVQADSVILQPEKGLVFYQDQPFSGTSIRYFSNGHKAIAIDYFLGKKDGKHIKWFENNTKSFEANYINGKQENTTTTWWRNGKIRSVATYEKGIAHGLQQQWYISGTKFKKLQLVQGREEGLQQSWRENGKIYNNYEAKNGRIFGLKRAKLCYALDNETVQFDTK